MAHPQAFDPPQLPEDAGELRQQFENGLVFHGRAMPGSKLAARLTLSYLVTTDKAAREYAAGCARVREQMQTGGTQVFAEAMGHFENCINATKRSLRLLERLTRQGVDRMTRKQAQNSADTLTDVRDAIEHIDKDIVSGLQDGEAHMLMITREGDALEITAHRLCFSALGTTIKALHGIGTAIVKGLPAT